MAIGGLFAFIAWAFFDLLFPEQDLDWQKWSFVGAGLAGVFGMTYVISQAALD